MARTRIRWQNVARLGGGVAIGALALFAASDLLEPAPPEPIPADVGLARGATGLYAYEPPPRERPERRPRRQPPPRDASPPPRERKEPREPVRIGSQREASQARPTTTVQTPPSPPAPPLPPSAPAAQPPAEPAQADPAPGDVKAEFGFEPRERRVSWREARAWADLLGAR